MVASLPIGCDTRGYLGPGREALLPHVLCNRATNHKESEMVCRIRARHVKEAAGRTERISRTRQKGSVRCRLLLTNVAVTGGAVSTSLQLQDHLLKTSLDNLETQLRVPIHLILGIKGGKNREGGKEARQQLHLLIGIIKPWPEASSAS